MVLPRVTNYSELRNCFARKLRYPCNYHMIHDAEFNNFKIEI